MTTFLLVRHAAHGLLGKVLAGRTPGLGLSEEGLAQAQLLVRRMHGRPLAAIYSSPQPRALQTAQPLALQRSLPMEVDAAFDEVDFGRWTGMDLSQLREDKDRWDAWVERRSQAGPPGGESFAAVHERAMAGIARLRALHEDQCIVVVSHGDVLKAVLAGFLGLSLDHVERFEIAPASLSIVETGSDWSQVKLVNGRD